MSKITKQDIEIIEKQLDYVQESIHKLHLDMIDKIHKLNLALIPTILKTEFDLDLGMKEQGEK